MNMKARFNKLIYILTQFFFELSIFSNVINIVFIDLFNLNNFYLFCLLYQAAHLKTFVTFNSKT